MTARNETDVTSKLSVLDLVALVGTKNLPLRNLVRNAIKSIEFGSVCWLSNGPASVGAHQKHEKVADGAAGAVGEQTKVSVAPFTRWVRGFWC